MSFVRLPSGVSGTFTLVTGDDAYVAPNIQITSLAQTIRNQTSSDHGISVTIDGTVASQRSAITLAGSVLGAGFTGFNAVTVGPTGIVHNADNEVAAIDVSFALSAIYNAGWVTGGDGLVLRNSQDGTVINDGLVEADGVFNFDGAGILIESATPLVDNSGTVRGLRNADGIALENASLGVRITNSGEITATRAITIDSTSSGVMTNSGRLVGFNNAVEAGPLADKLVNSGEIVGDVMLGDGADLYRGRAAGFVEGNVFGAAGDDTLIGSAAEDRLDGGADTDSLRGGAGDDTLVGGTGVDTLRGGAGDDSVSGGSSNSDRLFGGAGDDTLEGGAGANQYSGGTGEDSMTGGTGDEVFRGGRGDDIVAAGEGRDSIYGGRGDDILRGLEGVDTIYGGAGDDSLSGGASNSDRLFGGSGDDTLSGGGGSNRMEGGTGNDSIEGGTGNDTLTGGTGADTMSGGTGTDRFVIRPGDGRDVITDFGGSDRIDLTAYTFTSHPQITKSATTAGLRLELGDGDSLLLEGVTTVNNADFFF